MSTMESLQTLLQQVAEGHFPSGPQRCRCGREVSMWRELCAACREKQRDEDREMLLSWASCTLPQMPHVRDSRRLKEYVRQSLVRDVMRWDPRRGGLLITGPSGCGKTTVCVAKARMMLREALCGSDSAAFTFAAGIRFVTASDLALARKRHPLGEGEADLIEDARNATLLILDELGYEPQIENIIPDVANYRYSQGWPTFTTSGLAYGALVDRYGVATTRKLIGTGKLITVADGNTSATRGG